MLVAEPASADGTEELKGEAEVEAGPPVMDAVPLDGPLCVDGPLSVVADQGTKSRAVSAGATEKGRRVVVLRGLPGPWRRGVGAGPRRTGAGPRPGVVVGEGRTARG